MPGIVPDRVIINMMRIGVTAIRDNLEELDDILGTDQEGGLESAEVEKIKAVFTSNPPTVIQSYPRSDSTFPVFAVALISDTDHTEFIGESERQLSVDFLLGDETVSEVRERRRSDNIGVYVYSEHPDVCAYLYRVAKRIIEAGTPHLIIKGLDITALSGQELAPEPGKGADHLFVRRLTVGLQYEDEWPTSGPLWTALNGEVEGTATKIDHHREDIGYYEDEDGDIFGQGKLGTYDDTE